MRDPGDKFYLCTTFLLKSPFFDTPWDDPIYTFFPFTFSESSLLLQGYSMDFLSWHGRYFQFRKKKKKTVVFFLVTGQSQVISSSL